MSRLLVLYQIPLILQRSDKTVWQVKCHAAGVIPTPFQLLLMLRPSEHKPEQHILKPVRQIWAMERTESSRGKKKLMDAGFMFTSHAFSADSTKRFRRCVIRSCQWRLHTDVNNVIVNWLGNRHGAPFVKILYLTDLAQKLLTAISGRDSYLCMQRCYLWQR